MGTRGSELALWQSAWVSKELRRLHPALAIETTVIKTTGDKILDSPLSKMGIRVCSRKKLKWRCLPDDRSCCAQLEGCPDESG